VTENLERLSAAWRTTRDDEAGHAYGNALEASGQVEAAREVYEELIQAGYLIGYWDLAWLERATGHAARSRELLYSYLDLEDEPDEKTALVSGVLGHWIWDATHDADAEAFLIAGVDAYPSARADLADLYRASGRDEDAETVLREGVARDEVESFILLGNLLDETGRTREAESFYVRGFELGDAFCAYNLSLLLRREGRTGEADEWVRRGAERGDEKAAAYCVAFVADPSEAKLD